LNNICIAILGIGEAGGTFARDLIAKGVQVRGWDPEPRNLPDGLDFAVNNPAAASGADIVLSVNWASVAVEVAKERKKCHPWGCLLLFWTMKRGMRQRTNS
jgi:3-hydroxyisobutyrate dehydrogenase-like beta-hydroxyacid dehydrogenase